MFVCLNGSLCWLDVQVEELVRRSFLPEEEMQSIMFIRQMEKLGSLPACRRPADATSHG